MYRQQANILISTDHGTMIVNRFDYRMTDEIRGIGVGWQLMNSGQYDMKEVGFLKFLLERRLKDHGDGVVAIDCGANIGVHTIEWAKLLHKRGKVIALEAQEQVYYALCGNVALNNCFNVKALNCASGDENKIINIPTPDYFQPSSFGSLEIKQSDKSENIGQTLEEFSEVQQISVDSLALERLDLLKIDVEGMEFETLAGAETTISQHKPLLLIEAIKIDGEKMRHLLENWSYDVYPLDGNFFAVHRTDQMASKCSLADGYLNIST